jgi:2C-methyl-D-erythritol 2,4-cyclodiphosphate synthase
MPHSQRLKAVSNTDAKALAVLDAADLPELRAAFENLAIPFDEWESADMLRAYLVRSHINGRISGHSIMWALNCE